MCVRRSLSILCSIVFHLVKNRFVEWCPNCTFLFGLNKKKHRKTEEQLARCVHWTELSLFIYLNNTVGWKSLSLQFYIWPIFLITHPSLCIFLSSPVSIPLFFALLAPLSVLSPLLCSRGLYFTVPWDLLPDSTADLEAARKSYSALYQKLCCLALAIRRVLTPSSLHDHHHSCQTHTTHQRNSVYLCWCVQVAEGVLSWLHKVMYIHWHLYYTNFLKCVVFGCACGMMLVGEMRDSDCICVKFNLFFYLCRCLFEIRE